MHMKDTEDRGCDPLGNNMFRMVPSGDIVDAAEKERRLKKTRPVEHKNEILGMSWDQLERKQGGKLKRKKS